MTNPEDKMKTLHNRSQNAPKLDHWDTPSLIQTPIIGLQQILVPIDFSNCSYKALQYALAFATQFKADIILLHVIELYAVDYLFGTKSATEENSWLAEEAQTQLTQLSKIFSGDHKIHLSTIVRFGKPFREIANVAKERQVDLIITGTHGFTGLQRLELGSTTEKVVRYAPCPVMVVRGHEKEFIATEKRDEQTTQPVGAT